MNELPTDPNKLWPILEGFDGGSLTADPASPHSNASTMFQSIWNLITSEPLSPAFREALLEDAAKIPASRSRASTPTRSAGPARSCTSACGRWPLIPATGRSWR